jgi:hypothetical protein
MTNQEIASILDILRESVENSVNAYVIALALVETLEESDPSFAGRLKVRQEKLDREFSGIRNEAVERLQTTIERLTADS